MINITREVHGRVKLLGIELVALKKLSLVSHALADKFGGQSGDEQRCLAEVLDKVVRQIELTDATQRASKHGK